MVRQSGYTLSNIAINYLMENNFSVLIEFNNELFTYRWIAASDDEDLHLYASDPLSLMALYMIKEDWEVKKRIPNYRKELIDGNEVYEF